MKQIIFCTVLVSLLVNGSKAVNILPRPSVFVVTPAPRAQQINEARSAPFYYHNWMRRMDSPQNATSTTTSPTPKVKTPDLIFAEFESDSGNNMRKSIRKLLEQERVAAKTSTMSTTLSTTSQPIYVPEASNVNDDGIYSIPKQEIMKDDGKNSDVDKTDYFALYNNLYNAPAPVYLPKTTAASTTTSSTTSTTTPPPSNVENIWHIIDNEKHNQYVDKWEEVLLDSNKDDDDASNGNKSLDVQTTTESVQNNEDFALPGFGTNPGNGAENESRAIRTEQNFRFPYVSLKPFQVKNTKKPLLDIFSNSKKGNNMLTSLDNFKEMKYPVRGEVQDGFSMQQPIDRYNPAQPYLPQEYGSKSKQSSPDSAPPKAVANLVPPPPPPRPTGDDFPAPTSYESFPPYAPPGPSPIAAPPSPVAAPPSAIAPPPSPAFNPPVSMYRPPADISDDSGPDTSMNDGDDNSPMDLGYRYKPPSSSFLPTLPPLTKPFKGYSYDKPGSAADSPPAMDTNGYTYKKPSTTFDSPPAMNMGGYSYNPPPVSDEKPDFHGYNYDKPTHDDDHHHQSSYDHHGPSSYDHDSNYPELIFNKPHGDMGGDKDANDMKGNDMAVMAPPPPPDVKPGLDSGPPADDSGFPHDFPGNFKFHHHDFDDDHDFHYHHHHHPTTTTTETPRVNRYSYYYLGKKLYYLPLYFSVYFIVYVGALIIKAVLRHKIVYPNSWKPDGTTATFFSKRSVDSWDLSNDNLHEVTGRVTKAIAEAAEKYVNDKAKIE